MRNRLVRAAAVVATVVVGSTGLIATPAFAATARGPVRQCVPTCAIAEARAVLDAADLQRRLIAGNYTVVRIGVDYATSSRQGYAVYR